MDIGELHDAVAVESLGNGREAEFDTAHLQLAGADELAIEVAAGKEHGQQYHDRKEHARRTVTAQGTATPEVADKNEQQGDDDQTEEVDKPGIVYEIRNYHQWLEVWG